MLLHVEDLPDERDGCTSRDGAHGVHGSRKATEAFARKQAHAVEEDEHRQNKAQAVNGSNAVLMRRYEEQHARAQQDGAKNQGQQDLPLPAGGFRTRQLISTDRIGRFR